MESAPERWVLVTPGNPTVEERKFVRSLKGKLPVEVALMGRAKLDVELARHPSILRYATHAATQDALRAVGLMHAALNTAEDLDNAVNTLAERISARSLYWTNDVSMIGGRVTHTLRALRADAQEKEPINIGVEVDFTQLPDVTQQRLTNFLDFGGSEELVLPPEAVTRFAVEGPSWAAREESNVSLRMRSYRSRSQPIELRAVTNSGSRVATLNGTAAVTGRGQQGRTLEATLRGGLNMVLLVPHGGAEVQTNLSVDIVGVEAIDARRTLRFLDAMDRGNAVELYVANKRLLGGTIAQVGSSTIDKYTRQLVDDLARLSEHFDMPWQIPDSMTWDQRREIRAARLLADGLCIEEPAYGAMRMNVDSRSELYGATAAPGVAIETDLTFLILGQVVELPDVRIFNTDLLVSTDSARATHAADGRDVIIAARNGQPFRVYVPALVTTDPDTTLMTPVPLAIEGAPDMR